MEEQTTKIYQVNGRFKVVFERAASTKGIDGFKVEANADTLEEVTREAECLYAAAIRVTKAVTV